MHPSTCHPERKRRISRSGTEMFRCTQHDKAKTYLQISSNPRLVIHPSPCHPERKRRISRVGIEMLRNLSMTNPHFTIDCHPLSPYQPKHERRMTHKRCNRLLRHLIVNRQPVRRNLLLCLLQRNRPRTNLGMQIIFDLIFFMETWFRTGQLRPQIRDLIRAAQFQAHKMVNLILTRSVTFNPILSIHLVLLAIRHITHTLRVSRLTNSVFCSSRENGARCAGKSAKPLCA